MSDLKYLGAEWGSRTADDTEARRFPTEEAARLAAGPSRGALVPEEYVP